MNRKERRAAGKGKSSPQLRGGGPDVSDIFRLAVQHHQAGQLAEAERFYRSILAIDPRHVVSLNHLGILGLQSGRFPLAIESLRQALALNERLPEAHFNIAYAYYRLGEFDQAVSHYRHAVALKPDYADAHTNLGNVLKEQDRLDEAAACYRRVISLLPQAPEPHYNLANVLAQQEKVDEAIAAHREALARNPNFVGSHNNLATALAAKGETAAAIEHYRRALALKPDLTEAHINLGVMLAADGRMGEALEHYRRALAIDPSQAEAHTNLANALMSQGELDQATIHSRQALTLKPNSAEMHNNYGIVLAAHGKLDEAAAHFQQSLQLKPDFIDPYNNLGRAFLVKGRYDEALGVLQRALEQHENQESKALLTQCLRIIPSFPSAELRALVFSALSEPWTRPLNLASAAARAIKQHAELQQHIERANKAWPARLTASELLTPPALTAMCSNDLLQLALQTTIISDVQLEKFLTTVRFALLEFASTAGTGVDDQVVQLACALGRHCFLNEYVFAHLPEELALAKAMRDALIANATADAGTELRLALVGCFLPLYSIPGCEALLDRQWSKPIQDLLLQQISEPAQQRQLREAIPRLVGIDDRVSLLVQEQYEENPYPRWVKAEPPGKPLGIDQYFRGKFPAAKFRNLGRTEDIDILIAGCGTGQHAVETARRFGNARVLAIDLSLSSLSYAAFKTGELGILNIEYAQTDILKVPLLGRMFDVIESAGVLHHMADPFAGWRALLSCLRPSGFMAVGLYSEIARRKLEPGRRMIAERRYGSSAADIRQFRQKVIDSNDAALKEIPESGDFYSISTCRDLLFHVQEHRMTLPQIAAFLLEANLQFIGFELDAGLLGHYRQRFPQDTSLTDLTCWHIFEIENPKTFAGMYQFWVQKKPD